MSAATPIALFAIGFIVTQQVDRQEKRDKSRQAAAAESRERIAEAGRLTREAQIRNEAATRETEARQAAALLQRELRDLADERERQLRREGFDREKALRDEAYRREQDVRRQSLALAQSSALSERRIEFWDKLAPKFIQIDRVIDRILTGQTNAEELEPIFREIDDLFGLYRPYFTPSFESAYEDYETTIRAFVALPREPGDPLAEMAVTDGVQSICQRYFALRDGAASEVALGTGVAPNATQPRHARRMYAECQRREDVARARFRRPR